MSRTRILPLYLLYWSLLVVYLVMWGNLSNEYPAFFDDGAFYSMAYFHNAGLNFYDGIVDTKPPLLIYLTSFGFRLSPSISFIKWLSVSIFAVLILVVYLTLRYISGRGDIACFGATLIATNWSLRHYGVVELSQSYWQATLCLFSLVTVFGALSLHRHILLLFLGSFIWAIAFYIKQQSIVVLPAVVALILLYSWSYQTLKERFYLLGMFAVGAVGSVLLLYYPILGIPIAESYKYVFLSNMGRYTNSAFNDYGWWAAKGSAVIAILSASVRIPIIAFIGLEAQALMVRLVGSALSWKDRGVTSLSRNETDTSAKVRGGPLVIAMSVWTLSSVVFYFLHNQRQTHYLLELPITLAVLIPLIASAGCRYSPVRIMSINVMILGAVLAWHGVVTDPIGAAARDKREADRQVADVIGKTTEKEDRILLFTNPVLYCLADRLPASRFFFYTNLWTTSLMRSEYQQATIHALKAESTKVVVVHDRIMKQMPEWLRRLIAEELKSTYRALAFESKDVGFGMTQIYVRTKPTALLSTSVTAMELGVSS